MKNVNIVTYCTYKSLGSILQAYSLQKQLFDIGYRPITLVDKSEKQFETQKVHSLKGLCKKIFEKIILKKKKIAYSKRTEFIGKNINIEYLNGYSEFVQRSKEEREGIYLSGSDQVWQPDNCNPIFFLDFGKDKKCISYAASMGKTNISEEKKEKFQRLVQNFSHISVREEECVEIIRKITDKEIEVHIDPTFLISVDEWRNKSLKYDLNQPYILVYMLYWDKSCKKKIEELKKRTGLKVYAIADELSNVYADKVLYDVGVEEFLWLVDNAEYVVTSSFHGTAFATIFNKKFSAIINPNAPSRITNLLEKLSLPIIDIEDLPTCEEFNYQKTNQLIELEKEKSIEYLKRVIG